MKSHLSPHIPDPHGTSGLGRQRLFVQAAIYQALAAFHGPGGQAEVATKNRFARLLKDDPQALERIQKFAAGEIGSTGFPDSIGVAQVVIGVAQTMLLGKLKGAVDMKINTTVPAFAMAGVPVGTIHALGVAAPITAFDFRGANLAAITAIAETVISIELARDSQSENAFGRLLLDACAVAVDKEFLRLAHNGGSAIASGANTPLLLLAQVAEMNRALAAAGNDPRFNTLACNPVTLVDIACAQNTLGERAFPDVQVSGGNLGGLPLVPSLGIAVGELHTVAGDAVLRAFGVPFVDASASATLEMSSTPGASATPGETPVGQTQRRISLFQEAMVGLRAMVPFGVDFRRDVRAKFVDGIDLSAPISA